MKQGFVSPLTLLSLAILSLLASPAAAAAAWFPVTTTTTTTTTRTLSTNSAARIATRSQSSATTTSNGKTSRGRNTMLTMAVSSCWANEQGRELVERFGSVWEDEVEKVVAYQTLQQTASKDKILNAALDYIEHEQQQSGLLQLAQRRWPIRLPSRRATVGCFGRILVEMKAGRVSISGGDSSSTETLLLDELKTTTTDTPEEVQARQHLNALLELLSTSQKGVWALEREMIATAGIENFGHKAQRRSNDGQGGAFSLRHQSGKEEDMAP